MKVLLSAPARLLAGVDFAALCFVCLALSRMRAVLWSVLPVAYNQSPMYIARVACWLCCDRRSVNVYVFILDACLSFFILVPLLVCAVVAPAQLTLVAK